MHDTYPLRRRESRREAMSVERFHRGIGMGRAFELHRGTYILPAEQSKQSHSARRAVMSVERFHRGIGRGRSRSTVAWHSRSAQARVEARDDVSSTIPSGHWKGRSRSTVAWHSLPAQARVEARRCQLNDSIGALELPNGATALTPLAVFE